MSTLFSAVGVVSFFAGAYFLIRLILAVIRGQPKGVYAKKFVVAVAIVFVAAIGDSATRERPSPAKVATNETKQATDKKTAEEKVSDADNLIKESEALLAEGKAAEEKRLAEEKAAEEKRLAEEKAAKEKRLAEEKAAEEKRLAEEKAAEEKRLAEEKTKTDKVKEKLVSLENAGKIQYEDLGDGTYNVTITERADFKKYLGKNDLNKLANYALQDDHERNIVSTSNQCMQLVQTVKDTGMKVNYFTVNLTGTVEDMEGNRSVGNVVICEIRGNKSFKRDDPYSFYNNSDRYWMIDGL